MAKTKKVIIKFSDGEFEATFLVETKLTETELQKIVDKIINEEWLDEFEDWTYEDLINELEKKGHIKILETDFYDIYA